MTTMLSRVASYAGIVAALIDPSGAFSPTVRAVATASFAVIIAVTHLVGAVEKVLEQAKAARPGPSATAAPGKPAGGG